MSHNLEAMKCRVHEDNLMSMKTRYKDTLVSYSDTLNWTRVAVGRPIN